MMFYNLNKSQEGISIVELLMSMLVVGVSLAAMNKNIMTAFDVQKSRDVSSMSSSLAYFKLEELMSFNPKSLSSSLNETETDVSYEGIESFNFTRATTITSNSDGTKTLNVTVSSNNTNLPKTFELTHTVY